MNITEVRITLANPPARQTSVTMRALAFAAMTIDGCFCIRDIKVVEYNGAARVFMPTRKRADNCPNCQQKTPFVDKFCSHCGKRLPEERDRPSRIVGGDARVDQYADVCHAINTETRRRIERTVLAAYRQLLADRLESATYPVVD